MFIDLLFFAANGVNIAQAVIRVRQWRNFCVYPHSHLAHPNECAELLRRLTNQFEWINIGLYGAVVLISISRTFRRPSDPFFTERATQWQRKTALQCSNG